MHDATRHSPSRTRPGRQAWTWLRALLLLGCAAACEELGQDPPDAGQDGGDAGTASWYAPDPLGRTTQGDLSAQPPQMVLVTTAALAGAFAGYAAERTALGTPTQVVLLDELLASEAGRDDAERLRAALGRRVREQGLRFVLLGGDGELIPYRRVANGIATPTGSFTANGPSQLYFANVELDWDLDGDGVLGEKDDDFSLAQARTAQVAVGRVPVSNAAEVQAYRAKALAYTTAAHGRQLHSLLLSDIASTVPLLGDIDGAEGIEVTVAAHFPPAFRASARRLYATQGAVASYGGELLTPERVDAALDEGYSLAFHQGHGSHGWLTDRLDLAFVDNLQNALPTVLLSCACLSGNFADVAASATHDGWTPQAPDQDSAGERFVVGAHGGVVYVGNTAVGLGPIGGSQFLHAMMEAFFAEGIAAVGEAFNHARGRLRFVDWTIAGLPSMTTDDSEWWTQHAVILLGDPSIPLHTTAGQRPSVTAPSTYGPGFNELIVTVRGASDEPLAGVTVHLVKAGDFRLSATTDAAGAASFQFVPRGPAELVLGVVGPGLTPTLARISPVP